MALTPLAERLVRVHAGEPEGLFYGVQALGSMFRDADVLSLDAAYEELAAAGLMVPTGVIVTYFGVPKRLYRITAEGQKRAAEEAAA